MFRTALAVMRLAEPRLMRCSFEALTRELSAKNMPQLVAGCGPRRLLALALSISVSARLERAKATFKP